GIDRFCRLAAALRPDVVEQRRRDEERGIGTDHDAPQHRDREAAQHGAAEDEQREKDRKSTRLNSSHLVISYAVFCLKKKSSRILPKEYRQSCLYLRRPIGRLRLRHCLSLEVLVESFSNDALIDGSDNLLFDLTIRDNKKGGNAADVETRRCRAIGIDIQLADFAAAFVFIGDGIDG